MKKEKIAKEKPIGAFAKKKMKIVMDDFKAGRLHSRSKTGPIVKDKMQAVAIGLSIGKRAKK